MHVKKFISRGPGAALSCVLMSVCVCDYCSICELIRSRMSITRELLQFGVVEVHTAQCTTDTSTHTVGGNCTES